MQVGLLLLLLGDFIYSNAVFIESFSAIEAVLWIKPIFSDIKNLFQQYPNRILARTNSIIINDFSIYQ